MLELKVKKLRPSAKLPTKAHATDAGFDLYYCGQDPVSLYSLSQYMFETGISLSPPPGWYAQVHDRSSMGGKGIKVLGGVIDSGYTGEWFVMLAKVSGGQYEYHTIKPGDKIAQFVLLPVPEATIVEVAELEESQRGGKGFGSSDGNK
jgi:dUTP pyrophosphatase